MFLLSLLFSFQFYSLLERNKVAMSNFELRALTVFAPTNQAFQKYGDGSVANVMYHMCKFVLSRTTFSIPKVFHSFDLSTINSVDGHSTGELGLNSNFRLLWITAVVHNENAKEQSRLHLCEQCVDRSIAIECRKGKSRWTKTGEQKPPIGICNCKLKEV